MLFDSLEDVAFGEILRIHNSTTTNTLLMKLATIITAQKMKFSIKDFFSKCDQILRILTIS